jgi:hypothetical protein
MGEDGALASALNVHSYRTNARSACVEAGIAERCVVSTISVGHDWRGAHVMYKDVRMSLERRDARQRRCAGAA